MKNRDFVNTVNEHLLTIFIFKNNTTWNLA